jgi:hypothetical protein
MTATNANAIWRLTLDMAEWGSPPLGDPDYSYTVEGAKLDAICGADQWFVNIYRWCRENVSGSVCPGSSLSTNKTYVLVRGDTPATMLRMEDGVSAPKQMKPADLKAWRNMADEWDENEVGLFPWEVTQQHDMRKFILAAFNEDPHLKPPPTARVEHAGTIHAAWRRMLGTHPGINRIENVLRALEAEGVLRLVDVIPGRVSKFMLKV